MNSRTQLSLDGVWQFYFDIKGNATPEEISDWRQAQVPMPWQAQFEDLREQGGDDDGLPVLPVREARLALPNGAALALRRGADAPLSSGAMPGGHDRAGFQ